MTPQAARILDAMRWLEDGRVPMPWPRQLVAYAADHRPQSTHFRDAVAELNASGMIRSLENGPLVLEQEGREARALPLVEPWSRIAYWRHLDPLLSPTARRIVRCFRGERPTWLREELREACGHRGFQAALSKVLVVGLVDVSGEYYTRTQVLYPQDVFERRSSTRKRRSG